MKTNNRRIKAGQPYDIWSCASKTKSNKVHPSKKRAKQISLPHPGQSYRPDPEDHKRFLEKIAKKELAYQKKQANINRTLVDAEKAIDSDDTESQYSDYSAKDFEAIIKDKRVEEKRKTKKQRLAQMRDKLQRKAAKMRKLNNIKASKSIKKITRELDEEEKKKAAKQRHKRTKSQRLGPKFEPSDPIYMLSSELPSNLRKIKCPMDAIVREKLEGFQSRLLVEPTKFQTRKRKYKKKQYERQSTDERER